MLGRFEISVDGTVTPERCWRRRTAASLVKVLALAPGHRLHREQVIDMLWPDESPADAAPKLHKAAHYARKATGRDDAVVLRNDVVHLFPGAELTVDALVFDELSRRPSPTATRMRPERRSTATRASCSPTTATRTGPANDASCSASAT